MLVMGAGRTCGILLAAIAGMSLGLSACTRSTEEVRAGREAHTTGNSAPAAATVAIATDADMVSAVGNARSGPPIDLKFRLTGRPEVGQSLPMDLLIVPDATARVVRIHLSLQGGEGLQIEGSSSVDFEQIEPALRAQLRIKPLQEGVWSLSVTALVDTETSSVARTYSIPVIAGI